MKKIFIPIFILLTINIFSQDPQTHFILEDEIPSNVTKDYIGRDFVQMAIGFHSKPDALNHHVLAKTDPLLVFPPEGGEETGGSSNNNAGGVVGTLSGNLTVSPSGAAVYSIPFDLPTGVNNMTPSIGLTYNSQKGNGLLGVGWSLSGLSSISRVGTTIYNDGFIDGVDFDENDRFSLDGQRLISVNTEGTEFRTEFESFSKIEIGESNSCGPSWFKVYTKDGRIIEYGNSIDSKMLPGGYINRIVAWYINKISDRKGNYIEYNYYNLNGEIRISSIKYGGNEVTGQEHCYDISFNYTSGRHDVNHLWIEGGQIKQYLVLTNISISHSLGSLYSYNLWYDLGQKYTKLEKVTIGTGGEIYNPTIFSYDQPTSINYESTSFNGVRFSLGDFNGDGLSDYVSLPGDVNNWLDQNIEVYINNGNGDFPETPNQSFHMPLNYTYSSLNLTGSLLRNSYDFNGDGFDDLILNALVGDDDPIVTTFENRLDIYQSLGNTLSTAPVKSIWLTDVDNFTLGDFNGDGKADIFIFMNDNSWVMHLGLSQIVYSSETFNHDFDRIVVDDFNNDKKHEIMFVNDQGSSIYEFANDNLVGIIPIPMALPTYPKSNQEIFSGDFNGDGNADILTWDESESWKLELFTGNNFISNSANLPDLGILNSGFGNYDPEYFILIADVNGDGLSDIIELGEMVAGLPDHFFNIHYSNGIDFIEESSSVNLSSIAVNNLYADCDFINRGDFNGDGQHDIAFFFSFYEDGEIAYCNAFQRGRVINTITNGLGNTKSISYLSLTNSNCYLKGSGATYPIVDIQPGLMVTHQINESNGIGGENTTNYFYQGGKLHKEGKGFIGFENITNIINKGTANETKIENSFLFNTDYFFSWLNNSKISIISGTGTNQTITESLNQPPIIKDFGGNRFFFYIPMTINKKLHTGDENSSYINTTLTKYYYDDDDILYGNISRVEIYTDPEELTFSAPLQSFDFFNKVSYGYKDPDESLWLVNLIDSKATSSWSNQDEGIDNGLYSYYYFNDSPYIERVVYTPNGSVPLTVKTEYIYDSYGNIKTSRLYAPYFSPTIPDRITEYEYGPEYNHRLMTQVKNTCDGIEYTSNNTYYSNTGLLKTTTDIDELTTTFYYDGFGNPTLIVLPNGVQKRTCLFWSQNHDDNPDYGLFYHWSQSSGETATEVFFDNSNRSLRTITRDFKKNKIYRDVEYNAIGKVCKESNPHYSSNDLLWTDYVYTNSGLVKLITSPTATIQYDYIGRTTTVSNLLTNQESSKEANAIGQLVKSTDPGGIINYDYYGSGNIKSSNVNGIITKFEYDEAGNQTLLDDPSSNISTYTYNPFGELLDQTDKNNNTYKMEYDESGRLKRIYLVGDLDDIIEYSYNSEDNNGFGNIRKISMPNGISNVFQYDDLGRVISKSVSIDDQIYDFNYTYNIFGVADKITWPTRFSVNYKYKNGFLFSVEQTNAGKDIWKLDDVNAYGQIKQYSLGNGLITTKEFDIHGIPTGISTSQNVQENAYSFDIETGNLEWRSSSISPPYGSHTLKENFTYDVDLFKNRLKTWSVEGTGIQFGVDYSDNGNVELKTDIGTYDYTISSSNYAVDRILQPNNDYLEKAKNFEQIINYNEFNKVSEIWDINTNNPENVKYLTIHYGVNRERIKTELYINEYLQKTKYFVDGSFEVEIDSEGNLSELHYIFGGDGLFAIYTSNNTSTGCLNYVHKDYLGSYEVITDEIGNQLERLSYDPWGQRRNPSNWSYDDLSNVNLFDRGYTEHEHLQEFDLINMNGRIYDPETCRFLSPDNFVQDPGNTQSYNRYSYAINNPLIYTDPSGQSVVGYRKINGQYYGPGQLTEQETYAAVISYFATQGLSYLFTQSMNVTSGAIGYVDLSVTDQIMLRGMASFAGNFLAGMTSSLMTGGSFSNSFSTGISDGSQGLITSLVLETTIQTIYSSLYRSFDDALWLPEVEIVKGSGKFTGGTPYWWGFDWASNSMVLGIHSATNQAANIIFEAGMAITPLPKIGLLGKLARKITSVDGFLLKGFNIKTPFNIPVQRFGNMSVTRPDHWGLRIGSNKFVNRTFAAIKPGWNPLTQYTKGVIPKGTPINFGIIGPQGLRYPGGSLQFTLPSKNVIFQVSKVF